MIAELENITFDDGGGFRAGYITDTFGIWHFHHEYELVLHTKSNGTRIVGDSVELFDRYDLVLIGSNIPHCWNYYRQDDSLPDKHGIMLHFGRESLGDKLLSQHEMHSVSQLLAEAERGLAFSTDDARKAEVLLLEMISSKGIDKMISFFNLLKLMCSSSKRINLCSDNYRQAFDERGNKKMTDVYLFIRDNYFKPISMEQIAKVAKMKPFTFSKFFKQNSGAGFIEYLNRVRTNKACYLLRETEYHIHDIAVECGFGSISNFNKHFRKSEGFSPRDYRSQFRKL